MPLAPELRRLRARQGLRRFRCAAFGMVAAIAPLKRWHQRAVERTLLPGAPGALSAQRHFEATAPVYDSMGASDSTSSATFRGLSTADPADLAVPALVVEPSYRGGGDDEKDALGALVKRVLESMNLKRVEPLPLKRQNAEDLALMVTRICPTGTLKRKVLG